MQVVLTRGEGVAVYRDALGSGTRVCASDYLGARYEALRHRNLHRCDTAKDSLSMPQECSKAILLAGWISRLKGLQPTRFSQQLKGSEVFIILYLPRFHGCPTT